MRFFTGVLVSLLIVVSVANQCSCFQSVEEQLKQLGITKDHIDHWEGRRQLAPPLSSYGVPVRRDLKVKAPRKHPFIPLELIDFVGFALSHCPEKLQENYVKTVEKRGRSDPRRSLKPMPKSPCKNPGQPGATYGSQSVRRVLLLEDDFSEFAWRKLEEFGEIDPVCGLLVDLSVLRCDYEYCAKDQPKYTKAGINASCPSLDVDDMLKCCCEEEKCSKYSCETAHSCMCKDKKVHPSISLSRDVFLHK